MLDISFGLASKFMISISVVRIFEIRRFLLSDPKELLKPNRSDF